MENILKRLFSWSCKQLEDNKQLLKGENDNTFFFSHVGLGGYNKW